MRKIPVLCVLSLIMFSGLYSCKKDFANEQYTPITDTSKPDLSTKITASVSGFITDENNKAVAGALVTAGTKTATTNTLGYFSISNTSLSKTAAFVKITFSGYFNGYKTFNAQAGQETFIRMKLIPKISAGTINAATGGTVTTSDGASITLPSNNVVTASNGNAYTGIVHVAAYWINPSDSDLQLNMPGNLVGIDTAGYLKTLATFGMLAVELTDDAGNLLQITSGGHATLSFPISSALLSSAPAAIPLWSFNESNGLWKQESSAKKIGSNYIGDVNHFSYWNCDVGMSLVKFSTQIVDAALKPLANVIVSISISSPYNSIRSSYTDTSGFVYGMIPANSDITLTVSSSCGTPIYTKTFSTTNSDIDLGTLSVNPGQTEVTITGNIVNCNNSPVMNGVAYLLYLNGNSQVTQIHNGVLLFKLLDCPDGLPISLLLIDSATNQTASLLDMIPHDLGTIQICNAPPNQDVYLSYSIDGGNAVLLSTLISNSGYNKAANETQFHVTDTAGTRFTDFAFTGDSSLGTHAFSPTFHYIIDSTAGTYYVPTFSPSSSFTITEYGGIGGFISGSFTTTGAAYTPQIFGLECTITGSFRIKRTY